MTLHSPIHRWLTSPDGWSPASVTSILRRLKLIPGEYVWDPFAGSGTTAVVAAALGWNSISTDVSPLATLITRVKLSRPSAELTTRVANELLALDLKRVSRDGSLLGVSFGSRNTQLRRFMIAAAILRADWHLDGVFNSGRLRIEIASLRDEMIADAGVGELPAVKNFVWCADVHRTIGRVCTAVNRRVVMVTSPPFFGSDANPRVLRLSQMLGWRAPKGSNRWWTRDANDYALLLHTLADAAADMGCRAVAIEMSSLPVKLNGQSLSFADIISSALADRGYVVSNEPFETNPRDPSMLCIASSRPR